MGRNVTLQVTRPFYSSYNVWNVYLHVYINECACYLTTTHTICCCIICRVCFLFCFYFFLRLPFKPKLILFVLYIVLFRPSFQHVHTLRNFILELFQILSCVYRHVTYFKSHVRFYCTKEDKMCRLDLLPKK